MQMEGNFMKPFLPEKLKASTDIWPISGHSGTCGHMRAHVAQFGCVLLYAAHVRESTCRRVHPYARINERITRAEMNLQLLTKPGYTYEFELFCNSATKKRNPDFGEDFYLCTMISKTTLKFVSGPSHILHGCCKTKHDYYRSPRAGLLDSPTDSVYLVFMLLTTNV